MPAQLMPKTQMPPATCSHHLALLFFTPPPPTPCCHCKQHPWTHSLAADHLVLVVLAGQDLQGGLNDATTQAQHQVEGGLCGSSSMTAAAAEAGRSRWRACRHVRGQHQGPEPNWRCSVTAAKWKLQGFCQGTASDTTPLLHLSHSCCLQ
jgi:hypothetical protein